MLRSCAAACGSAERRRARPTPHGPDKRYTRPRGQAQQRKVLNSARRKGRGPRKDPGEVETVLCGLCACGAAAFGHFRFRVAGRFSRRNAVYIYMTRDQQTTRMGCFLRSQLSLAPYAYTGFRMCVTRPRLTRDTQNAHRTSRFGRLDTCDTCTFHAPQHMRLSTPLITVPSIPQPARSAPNHRRRAGRRGPSPPGCASASACKSRQSSRRPMTTCRHARSCLAAPPRSCSRPAP